MEEHYIDTFKTSTALSDSWVGGELDPTALTLCAPIKGTGSSNRDGDHIIITKIQIRGILKLETKSEQDDVSKSEAYRVMLIWDKQTNGAQLNAEDVMVATEPEVFSYRNQSYLSRFKILTSWDGCLKWGTAFTDGANKGSVGGGAKKFMSNIECMIPVDFKANNGDVTDIVDNSLHIIGCAENSNTIYIQYACRVLFEK